MIIKNLENKIKLAGILSIGPCFQANSGFVLYGDGKADRESKILWNGSFS